MARHRQRHQPWRGGGGVINISMAYHQHGGNHGGVSAYRRRGGWLAYQRGNQRWRNGWRIGEMAAYRWRMAASRQRPAISGVKWRPGWRRGGGQRRGIGGGYGGGIISVASGAAGNQCQRMSAGGSGISQPSYLSIFRPSNISSYAGPHQRRQPRFGSAHAISSPAGPAARILAHQRNQLASPSAAYQRISYLSVAA